jgi:hypothetical protein
VFDGVACVGGDLMEEEEGKKQKQRRKRRMR